MKESASASLFDDLQTRGFIVLTEMIDQKREESLHLEFKTLANHSALTLTKEDRRLIAKAICGLSNAEGGLLVLGVETTKSDGIDIANSLKPFENAEALRNRITSALPEFLSPQNPKISAIPVSDPSDSSKGYIAIQVLASDSRPHMSVAHHQYFRRGSDGTRLLEHGEVKELMLLPQQAKLSLQLRVRQNSSMGYNYAFDCILSLRNEGNVPARAPFVRAEGCHLGSARPNDSTFSARRNSLGIGIYTDSGVLVHVGDELDLATIRTGVQLKDAQAYDAKFFIKKVLDEKLISNFLIHPSPGHLDNRVDQLINANVSYGGENAAIQSTKIAMDKWTTFQMMAKELLK